MSDHADRLKPMARRLKTVDPDCRTCGACCVASEDVLAHADMLDRDASRLRSGVGVRRYRALVLEDESAIRTRYDRVGNVVCAALRGTPGVRASCTVYEHRPSACRDMRPGSSRCRAIRRWFSEESGRELA